VLICAASGYPRPVITWSKIQGSLPSGRSQQVHGKLTISDFQMSDSGLYHCKAVNSLGEQSVYTALNVGE